MVERITNSIGEVTVPDYLDMSIVGDDVYDTSKLKFTWEAPTTTIGSIAGYDVYCNGVFIERVYENSCIINNGTGIQRFSVMALNKEGIYSEMSYGLDA